MLAALDAGTGSRPDKQSSKAEKCLHRRAASRRRP
jgi:hypothetical protein